MQERISKSLIEKGMQNKTITFGMYDGQLTARIGGEFFFICDEEDKTESDFTQAQLADMVHEAINSEPINDNDDDKATECLYYKAVLERDNETKGYTIADNMGMLEIQRIDELGIFPDDDSAVEQAVKDGIKLIPVEELPENFERRYLGWIDTPENRAAIQAFCNKTTENKTRED